MKNNKKIIAVLPAYNAAKTLKLTLNDIPADWVDEIILVDDASSDNTVELAKKLGLKTFVHSENKGYGGNQKTCYNKALKLDADIVIMIHPDHQYDPTLVPEMLLPIINNEADAVFGSRMLHKGEAIKGGMPKWKYLANKFLTIMENSILHLNLSEYHSGFRAYNKKILNTVQYNQNSDNFVFDTEIIVQLKIHKFKIKEIPIPTKYFKDASSVGLIAGSIYGLSIIKVLLQYLLHSWNIKQSSKFI
ncbi:MAG: glycosyltransferase family 2 protein [bacterium]|nr:glycosyltransferase family 2 protein [bacterium]